MISAVSPIEYENRNTPPRGERAFRTAVFCGASPLVLGVSILVGFYSTESWLLPFLGLATILFGLISVLIGLIALRKYFRAQVVVEGKWHSRAARRFWLTLLLLLANFPIAFACIVIGDRLTKAHLLNGF